MRYRIISSIIVICGALLFVGGPGPRAQDREARDLASRARAQFGPLPVDMADEAHRLTAEKLRLGKILFYESRISIDGTVSCARCHPFGLYAADGLRTSIGNRCAANPRNAPTVLNAAGQISQHWIGNRTDVEDQARQSVTGAGSFGMPSSAAVEDVLKGIAGYRALFEAAFPGDPEPITVARLAEAIGAFERTLVTPSPFDAYLSGDESALNPAEKKGLAVFLDAGCASCHSGTYVGGGMYRKFGTTGPYWELTKSEKIDEGRFAVTKNEEDRYVFKVPGLRNVARTPPYFHDGSVDSLETAVGIMSKAQLGRDLPPGDRAAIAAFLGSLTGRIPEDALRIPELPSAGPAAAATAASLSVPADHAAAPSTSSQAEPTARGDASAAAETRTYLGRLEKLGFAGVVLVARGATPLFVEGFGLADRERNLRWTPGTVSDIGSITKQFTAAAILKLEEEGELRVTDPLSRYFPDIPADKAAITLHNLLSHSSGLTDPNIDDYDAVPLSEYVRQVFTTPLRFAPGAGYSYENANFSLLGAVIEKLSGESYEAFVRERLFLPNGMFETGYKLPQWGESGEGRVAQGYIQGKPWGTILGRPMAADGPHWALRANGGIHTTVYDMLRWARALLDGSALKPESMKKLWAPHSNEGGGTFYGYGWSIAKGPDGTPIATHNGGNGIFYADLAIVPGADLVVFLMTNVIADNRSANSLLGQLGRRFLAGAPYPAIPEIVDLSEKALSAFAGTYKLQGKSSFRVMQEGGALFIEAEGGPAFDVLNSVRAAVPGRLDKLTRLADRIIAGNLEGDFVPLFKAYGGGVPIDRLRASWAESIAALEKDQGKFLRYEVLGTARAEERDETVVRLFFEKGPAEMTYVWDLDVEGRLLGRSRRGLMVRMRLYPSGEWVFFTWDGGVRPPKPVRFEPDADGTMRLTLPGSTLRPARRSGS